MFKKIKAHLRNHRGDANVSKVTIIAIAFVVGAILLTLTTSAFRNPINRWFANVSTQWFSNENGEYALNDPFMTMTRAANGSYEGAVYIARYPDGHYWVLEKPNELPIGEVPERTYYITRYDPSGKVQTTNSVIGTSSISADGKTITWGGFIFEAELP